MTQSQKRLFWQQHIRAWQTSTLSQAAYCAKHKISLASFGYWRTQLRASVKAVPAVIPVLHEAPGASVQLRSPHGWHITLPAAFGVDTLRGLLAALP